jgi:hypothetical protein
MGWFEMILAAASSGGVSLPGTTTIRAKMNGSGTFGGQSWVADTTYRTGTVSNTFNTSFPVVLDTNVPTFYNTGVFVTSCSWTFPVAAGLYDVYLYLIDSNSTVGPATTTAYNISLNGTSVDSNLVLKQFLFEPVTLRKKYTVDVTGSSIVLNLSRALTFDLGISGVEIVPAGTAPTIGVTDTTPFAAPAINGTNTKDKVFDGNNSTEYISAGQPNIGAALGYDLGSSRTVATINFTPSPSSPARSNGAKFYGSNTKYTGYTLLYTIPAGQATVGAKTAAIPSDKQGPWRYIVFEAPANTYCNFAELSVP